MQRIRKSEDRGHAQHGWLESFHSFSFAGYHDARYLGFGPLRVVNEDRVQPGEGFGMHSHQDMEIISYVLEGALEHQDSLGSGSVIRYGDVQRMSAGSGVQHSEFNHSRAELVHFLQLWIIPDRKGIEPSYEERNFPVENKRGRLCLIASGDGRDGSVTIHQDATIHASILGAGDQVSHAIAPGRQAYVQVLRGKLSVNGVELEAGDALMLIDESDVTFRNAQDAELLLFDLPS